MKSCLHSWNVTFEEAIAIQERLRDRIVLERVFSDVKTIGGGDVAYDAEGRMHGIIAVMIFPEMKFLCSASATGNVSFPYVSGLLAFREAPILIEAFERLRDKPDVLILDGQGVAHPRGFGLACHLGLWLEIPTIGCTKTPLLCTPVSVGPSRGDVQYIEKDGKQLGAILRTKEKVRPIFVSPGNHIDLKTSVTLVLEASRRYRMPEPLRFAHRLSRLARDKGGRRPNYTDLYRSR